MQMHGNFVLLYCFLFYFSNNKTGNSNAETPLVRFVVHLLFVVQRQFESLYLQQVHNKYITNRTEGVRAQTHSLFTSVLCAVGCNWCRRL